MMFEESRADRIKREAWRRGDYRPRCDVEAHLMCTACGVCACASDSEGLDAVEFPTGKVRVTTDKQGRTGCRECRYQEDVLGNVYFPRARRD